MTALPSLAAPKPVVLVSQCLQGQAVRYDGGHKDQPLLHRHLWPAAQALGVCPELAAGLGLPRPPIRRQRGPEGEYLALAETGAPAAAQLVPHCRTAAGRLAENHPNGALLKARSPSCGYGTSPLFNERGQQVAIGDGVWVQALRAQLPGLLIVDETQLQSVLACRQFLGLLRLHWLVSRQALPAAWRAYLQQANPHHAGADLGLAQVANAVGREGAALKYLEELPWRH